MKRFLALFLMILVCTGLLVGCNNETPPAGEDTVDTSGSATEAPATEAPATDAPAEPAVEIKLIVDGKSEYDVIYPEKASKTIRTAAVDFITRIKSATKASMRVNTDTASKAAHEIVIGECDRPEVAEIKAGLREFDHAIVYADGRVYIIGGSDDATIAATEYFIDKYVNADTATIDFMSDLNDVYSYAYTFGTLSIGGVDIEEYNIVIPEKCSLYTSAAADNLADYFWYNGGYEVEVITDKKAASQYEILIGETNRPESKSSVDLGKDQYILAATGSKIVILGESYMIGGGVSDLINNYIGIKDRNTNVDIKDIPTTHTAKTFSFQKAENALLLIGDGMGFNHIEATIANGIIDSFVARELPVVGQAVTFSHSVSIGKADYTDSAAAATALSTGYKTINGYLGIGPDKQTNKNIRELAHEMGANTAVLTTDVITGATPGGFLVHHESRKDTEIIQGQIDALLAADKVDFAVGSIGDKLVSEAGHELWNIAHNGSRYFAMIEEAQIDKKSHNMDLKAMMPTLKRYNELIAYCVEFVICHPNTVLIITADHETGGLTLKDGKYEYTSDDHTNVNVPLFAIGAGTEEFHDKKTNNIEIPKFIAPIYGYTEKFGQ